MRKTSSWKLEATYAGTPHGKDHLLLDVNGAYAVIMPGSMLSMAIGQMAFLLDRALVFLPARTIGMENAS